MGELWVLLLKDDMLEWNLQMQSQTMLKGWLKPFKVRV